MPGRGRARWLATALLFCVAASHAVGPDPTEERASADVRYAAAWILDATDHQGRPFAIVDKRDPRIYVFGADGRPLGTSAILLGLTPGDEAALDSVGRPPSSLGRLERTTPAGRYSSQPGHNDKGEPIVWFDYDAALAIHRLRPAPATEQRPQRMLSTAVDDHRITLGCVVVRVAFYEAVVEPALGRQRGVVYVLPETRPVQSLLGAIEVGLDAR